MFAYCRNNPVNLSDPDGKFAIQAVCAAIGAVAGWYFGDYVARKLGYKSGVVVGGAVIGWFAGSAIANIAKSFLWANPTIMARMPGWMLKVFGLEKAAQRANTRINLKWT